MLRGAEYTPGMTMANEEFAEVIVLISLYLDRCKGKGLHRSTVGVVQGHGRRLARDAGRGRGVLDVEVVARRVDGLRHVEPDRVEKLLHLRRRQGDVGADRAEVGRGGDRIG